MISTEKDQYHQQILIDLWQPKCNLGYLHMTYTYGSYFCLDSGRRKGSFQTYNYHRVSTLEPFLSSSHFLTSWPYQALPSPPPPRQEHLREGDVCGFFIPYSVVLSILFVCLLIRWKQKLNNYTSRSEVEFLTWKQGVCFHWHLETYLFSSLF